MFLKLILEDERVNYICRGDYSVNSDLDKIVKLIITQVSILETLINKESELLGSPKFLGETPKSLGDKVGGQLNKTGLIIPKVGGQND